MSTKRLRALAVALTVLYAVSVTGQDRAQIQLRFIDSETGFAIPLLPIEGGRFFDRSFWSFVRFEKDKLIYRNGDTDYVAVRE